MHGTFTLNFIYYLGKKIAVPLSYKRRVETNWTWNRLVPNWERNTSRLYIATLFINLYAEYIMQNAGLDATQTGIKIAGRSINNLRYENDTTLKAESEEELKSLLIK